MHVEQLLAKVLEQGGRFGSVFVGHQGVPHVDHGTDVGPVDLFDQEKGFAHRSNEAVCTGLFGLVLDNQLDVGHVLRAFDGAVDNPVPRSQIVGLEGIIVAILPEPQIHYLAVQLPGPLHGFLDLVDGLAPDLGIVGREGAPSPLARSPNIGCDAGHFQTGVSDLTIDLFNVVIVHMPQTYDLNPGQPFHTGGSLNKLFACQALAIT